MPAFYPDSIQFPKTVKAILESLIIYTAQILYPDIYVKDPIMAMKRIVISDLDAGNEFLLRTQTNYFESLNFEFPITFYQIDSREFKTNYNQVASRGEIYSFDLKRKISAFPNGITIKMITVYNHPDDYMRANTILQSTNAKLTRLYSATKFIDYEHNINKILPLPFDLVWEISKGSYTFKFQEYLKINKLYDIVHDAKILFFDFMLSDYLELLETKKLMITVNSITDNTIEDSEVINFAKDIANKYEYTIDNVQSSLSPDSVVPTSLEYIEFYFKTSIKNQVQFENEFNLFPYANKDFIWNDDGDMVKINFLDPLSANTKYEVSFNYEISSFRLIFYYTLSFTTGD